MKKRIVDDAEIIEDGGTISYKVTMEVNDKRNELLIDDQGKLLKYNKELSSRDVPAKMLAIIRSEYGPIDIDDAWLTEETGKINYSINGEISDKDHSFLFDNNFALIKHEQEMKISEVPVLLMMFFLQDCLLHRMERILIMGEPFPRILN